MLIATAAGWAGATLLLGQLRWFRRVSLHRRLEPYAPAGTRAPAPSGSSVRAALAPVAAEVGGTLARLAGVHEDPARRLERIHAPLDASGFRLRQLGWAVAAFGAGLALTLAFALPPALGLLFVIGGPVLAYLLLEDQLGRASRRWQRRLFLELPVVTEQLGMLLGAGYSLGGALHRLAGRADGACATDLDRVCGRIRHGVDELAALREWAEVADVDALTRLVDVLALNRQAADLGPLITEEARATRAEVQRELIETVERRAQQVWVPVTVATLLPGVIFLAVPFIEAMRLFGRS